MHGSSRRLAIIPARTGSKRIPNKNTVDLSGRPLINYPIRTAIDSGLFDIVHVSTESPTIAESARRQGASVEFLRTDQLSNDTASLLDVLRWVLDQFAAQGDSFQTVCLLTATAALIEVTDLTDALAKHEEQGGLHPTLAVSAFPAPVEQALELDPERLLRFWMPDLAPMRSQDLATKYFDTGTFMFFDPAYYFQNEFAELTFYPYIIPRWKGIDVNDPEDLDMLRIVWSGLHPER